MKKLITIISVAILIGGCAEYAKWSSNNNSAEYDDWKLKHSLQEQLECRDILVKRDYCSDGPGWVGDLFIIIWGEPNFMTYIGKTTREEWTVFKNGEI